MKAAGAFGSPGLNQSTKNLEVWGEEQILTSLSQVSRAQNVALFTEHPVWTDGDHQHLRAGC